MKDRPDASLLRAIFDAYPAPTLLLDQDLAVLQVNAAAARLRGDEIDWEGQLRAGDLLGCCGARGSGCGCGRSCAACVLRDSVRSALGRGAVFRRRARIRFERGGTVVEAHFSISAAPFVHQGRTLAILTLEDVTELVRLRSLLPICAHCRRVRNEDDYWQQVEAYFKERMDLDFTHGICEECLEKHFPAAGAATGT